MFSYTKQACEVCYRQGANREKPLTKVLTVLKEEEDQQRNVSVDSLDGQNLAAPNGASSFAISLEQGNQDNYSSEPSNLQHIDPRSGLPVGKI